MASSENADKACHYIDGKLRKIADLGFETIKAMKSNGNIDMPSDMHGFTGKYFKIGVDDGAIEFYINVRWRKSLLRWVERNGGFKIHPDGKVVSYTKKYNNEEEISIEQQLSSYLCMEYGLDESGEYAIKEKDLRYIGEYDIDGVMTKYWDFPIPDGYQKVWAILAPMHGYDSLSTTTRPPPI